MKPGHRKQTFTLSPSMAKATRPRVSHMPESGPSPLEIERGKARVRGEIVDEWFGWTGCGWKPISTREAAERLQERREIRLGSPEE